MTTVNGTGLSPEDRAQLDEWRAEEDRRWEEAFEFQQQQIARQRAWNEGQLIAQATFHNIGKQVENTLEVMQSGIRSRLNAEYVAAGGDPVPEPRFSSLDVGGGSFDAWEALAELPRRDRTTGMNPLDAADGALDVGSGAADLAGSTGRRVTDG